MFLLKKEKPFKMLKKNLALRSYFVTLNILIAEKRL
jgi:hypothetical protein